MKQTFLIVLILASFLGIHAQIIGDYAITDIPEHLLENANSVIRYSEQTLEIKSKKEFITTEYLVVTIFEKDSPFSSNAAYYNQNSSVIKMEGRILDWSGTQVKKKTAKNANDISTSDQSTIADDSRVKVLEFDNTQLPYTIIWEIQTKHKGGKSYTPWFTIPRYNVAIQESKHVILHPEGFKFNHRHYNNTPKETKDIYKKQQRITWEYNNLKAIKNESYSPNILDIFPHTQIYPIEFSFYGHEGSLQDWKSFGKFFSGLNKEHNDMSQTFKDELKEMTVSASSDKEKIDIIYNYLQKNTRYVSVQLGIGGFKSFPASYVEKNKYGDCKALSYFTKSMLDEVGIDAIPAIIQRSSTPFEVEDDFVYDRFNHILLYVPSEDTWLECTSSDFPVGYIGQSNCNRKALLLTENGGELKKTPIIEKDLVQIEDKYTVHENGDIELSSDISMKEGLHEKYRYIVNALPEKEQEEYLLKKIVPSKFDLKTFSIQADSEQPKVNIHLDLRAKKKFSPTKKRVSLGLSDMASFANISTDGLKERTQDIIIDTKIEYQKKISINFPESMTLESVPSSISFENQFGKIDVQFKKNPTDIAADYKIEYFKGKFPKEDYKELEIFQKKISKLNRQKIIWVKAQSSEERP